jgi:Na+-driven multidrug efflux pump
MLAMEGSNAQDKKNLVRYACVLGGIYGIFFLILSLSLPSQLLTFAGGGGSKILMFMAADSILVPIASLLAGKLEGSNKQTVSGVIGAAISLAVRIPLAFALGKAFGLNGVAIAIPLSSLALIIGMLIANIVISKKQKESEATYYVAKQY